MWGYLGAWEALGVILSYVSPSLKSKEAKNLGANSKLVNMIYNRAYVICICLRLWRITLLKCIAYPNRPNWQNLTQFKSS